MRLVDPGPGELLDRLTILGLKIKAATDRGLETKHFTEEREQIVHLLYGWSLVSSVYKEREAEWTRALTDANQRVWEAIDLQRIAKKEFDTLGLARWGLKALDGNDDRAAIIREINKACSPNSVLYGEEKVPAAG